MNTQCCATFLLPLRHDTHRSVRRQTLRGARSCNLRLSISPKIHAEVGSIPLVTSKSQDFDVTDVKKQIIA